MRRTLIILFTVFLVVLACSLISCGNGTDKGAETTRTESAGLEFVSNGDGTCSVSGIGDCIDADVVIPLRSSAGESVTGIKERAFKDCNTVTSVFIPESVKTVGRFAFYNCTALTSAVISDGVETIGEDAFHGCSTLASVSLGADVTGFVVDDKNVRYFSDGNCLIEMETGKLVAGSSTGTIPTDGSVIAIGECAFEGFVGLTSITIPNGVMRIGFGAFVDCEALASITIPASVTTIEPWVFVGCSALTSIHYQGTVEQWEAIDKGDWWDHQTGDYTIYCTDGEITK